MATAIRSTSVRASRGRSFVALVAGLLLAGSAVAQNPVITATYLEANPKDAFTFTWDKARAAGVNTKNVGTLRWGVPETQFGTSGLDRAFDTYCAESQVPINSGKTYRFEVQSSEVPEAYGLPDTDEGRKEAIRRTQYVRELYGRHYPATLNANDPVAAPAFQIALWELLQESGPTPEPAPAAVAGAAAGVAAVANPFDLFNGGFQTSAPAQAPGAAAVAPLTRETSSAVVQRAQDYLRSLTGNDSVYYENPDLAGRELVRLKGLPNVAGEVAQSQLALRHVVGGGGGGAGGASGAAGGVVAGGGLLAGGGVGRVGGFAPTSLAGGGGLGGVGGFGPGSGVPTTTTSTVPVGATTPPTTVPNTPINPPTSVPPVGGSPPSTQPPEFPDVPPGVVPGVPAPPAVLLGLVGVGLLAGRKFAGRKAAK
ncbi:MAG TPA: hypothetical protein VMZ71_01125 [Gemmataceae bacterium]|nr:hypothetical protein [Gemmataceae bacterium]